MTITAESLSIAQMAEAQHAHAAVPRARGPRVRAQLDEVTASLAAIGRKITLYEGHTP
jgi:hypothetical protein